MLPKEAAEGPEDIVSRERYQADTYQQRLMRDVVSAEIGITFGKAITREQEAIESQQEAIDAVPPARKT
jgi:hypothetical protein